MANIHFLVVSVVFWSVAGAEDKGSPKRNIKGQQYVRQTTVARLVGGPVPPELLHILQSNSTVQPIALGDNEIKKAPHLVTEEVKTTVTKMVIPLTTAYTDSERYLTMIRKFLVRNGLNLSHVDRLESTTDTSPPSSAIIFKLQAAANLRANMVIILGHILALPEDFLPKNHHAPLAHIHRLLQLHRIPVIDLLEHYTKLSRASSQEQWLSIFIELEKHIPVYMKSCATFLIESLQDKLLNIDEILQNVKDSTMPKLLTGIPNQDGPHNPTAKPLLFPKRIFSQLKQSHEEALGRTMACILAAVADAGRNYTPRLLALFLLYLPRNTPSPQFDDNAFALASSQDNASAAEFDVVADAFESSLQSNATPSEIFQMILRKIVQQKFDGHDKYERILNDFEIPLENYLI